MAKDKFFLNVRTAVGTLLPRVDEGHPYTEPSELERILRGATFWLNQKSVDGFDPGDFKDTEGETLEILRREIATFLKVASKVNGKKPATPDAVDAALPPFLNIASIVRKAILDDWLLSARGLINQASQWAEAEGWPTKRHPWTLTERFLGTYELERLLFGVVGSQIALIPVGRFVLTSEGSFDLAVMPAYDSVMVARGPSKKWLIRPFPGENTSHRWSRSAFVEASEKLARMG